MTGPDGRRTLTVLLAASLGLNLALGGIFIYQATTAERTFERRLHEWRRSPAARPEPWQSRSRAERDTTDRFPRLEQEQVERIRELRGMMEEDIRPLRTEINSLQEMMREELRRPEPSISRLDSMAARTSQLQTQIQQRSLRLMLEEKEILTADQFGFYLRFMMPGRPSPGGGFGRDESGRGEGNRREGNRGPGPDRSGRVNPPEEHRDPPPPPPLSVI